MIKYILLTLPQEDLALEVSGLGVTSLPAASSSSANPQLQSLQAFAFFVVAHTSNKINWKLNQMIHVINANSKNIPLSEDVTGFFKSSASNKSSSEIVSELLSSSFHAEITFSFVSEFNITLSLEPIYQQ